jgi:cob(I)alamin adenosyltransferase
MNIYTRHGDQGFSSLFDGTRVPKHHPRLDAVGTLDELNSHLGLAAAVCPHPDLKSQCQNLQRLLLTLGADLATPHTSPNAAKIQRIGPGDVLSLEHQIDAAAALLPPLKRFILPGGSLTAAQLHVARTVCRRAERQLSALLQNPADPIGDFPLIFVNRLGDLLFVLARLANHFDEINDLEWNI